MGTCPSCGAKGIEVTGDKVLSSDEEADTAVVQWVCPECDVILGVGTWFGVEEAERERLRELIESGRLKSLS